MKTKILSLIVLAGVCCFSQSVLASVRLPRILSDGMVLQRNDSIKIWGWADAGEAVTVKFQKKTYKTITDAEGRWMVQMPPRKVGGPYVMQVNDQTLQNVYVGDVWLISGQSNIDVHIERVHRIYEEEVYKDANEEVRLIQLDRALVGDGEKEDIGRGSYAWEGMNPDPAKINHWSALSYFFAKELWQKTGVPQGVINASLGGSNIIAWLDRETMQNINPRYIQQLDHLMQPGYLQRNGRINAAVGRVYNQILNEEDPGFQQHWMNDDTDDSDWEVVNQYDWNIGEENGRPWRGTLWFRKSFEVPADMAGKEATLFLGYIFGSDDAYINGRHVGNTGYEYPPRIYKVPAGLLRAGTNTVTIRMNTGGSPMKFQKDKPYRLVFGNIYQHPESCTIINLEGNYKMHRGILMPSQPGTEGISNGNATVLHNGQIAPLKNLHIAGIVWYQGETNVGNPTEYATLLPALMNQWRNMFGKVPAIICSLANYQQRHTQPARSNNAQMRDVQRKTALEIGNAGLANMADLGEWNDIHPWRKKEAAHRCVLQARKLYLNEKNLVAEGPMIDKMTVAEGKAILTFKEGSGRLVAKQPIIEQEAKFTPAEALPIETSGKLLGFTVCDEQGKYYNAEACIEGDQVIVWCNEIQNPQAVRYGWDDDPILSLYNEFDLPAAPFEVKR